MTSSTIDRPVLRSPYWIPSNVSISLNHEHIAEALGNSQDDGETLVFSKLDLTDISVDAAEELATKVDSHGEGVVKRIALGNNRLTTLPTELALLTRLRYLNLKNNSFSTFPRALTLIRSLDTLDISHNKIRRLPNEPGSLVNLRVFCFSRNKISRLPTYLSQFHKLEVLHADRNPMEWPPKAVMEFQVTDDISLMKEWIQNVQGWMDTESSRTQSDDSIYHERVTYDKSTDNFGRSSTLNGNYDEASCHGRSYSMDSTVSLSSITESLHEASSPEFTPLNKPPPLRLGILRSNSPESSPTQSFGDGISPASRYDLEIPGTFEQMQNFDPPALHNRTASDAEGMRHPPVPMLYGKKSLPDLRKVHTPIIDPVPAPPITHAAAHFIEPQPEEDTFQHSSSSSLSMGPKLVTPSSLSDTSDSTPAVPFHERITSMATERNSYFRRLSTLPLSDLLPQHLTNLAESTRSFLFAMCQIYQSLEQYAALVIDDRFSVVLRKVLDPAHSDMIHFIQALERFDSASRASLPAPSICRTLMERCRDCAAAFGKTVNVLALHLRVDPGEDLRFSRWMLLEMYAATAEIGGAWKSMESHLESLKSYLRAKDPVFPSHAPESTPALEVPSQHTLRVGISGRTRTVRRHAGSFSSKDVEIGKKLPSYDMPSAMAGGVLSGPAPHVPMLRTPKRQATAPVLSSTPKTSSPLPFWHQNSSDERFNSHVRQGSHKSISYFSPSSSPSLAAKHLDPFGNSRRKVDFEALNAIQDAVETAPKVWDMVADTLLTGSVQNERDVREILEQARSITNKLSNIITKMHSDDVMSERRLLQEDAQVFLKVVVKISSFVKTHSVIHSVPSALRSSIVKLTKMTEEFAILLHVSSFTPSTPRSFSPMLINSANSNQDGRLTSNLSRTKSAHPPNIKIPHLALNDGPRSALSSQSFKLPDMSPNLNRRIHNARETRLDTPAFE